MPEQLASIHPGAVCESADERHVKITPFCMCGELVNITDTLRNFSALWLICQCPKCGRRFSLQIIEAGPA